jgi:predicted PurR-regulated permease PerM
VSEPTASTSSDGRSAFRTVARVGAVSWSIVGVVVLSVLIAVATGALSGILVPLVIAVALGIVLEPVTDALSRWGVPRTAATALTVLALLAAAVGLTAIAVLGFLRQWPQIYAQLNAGWNAAVGWLREHDADTAWVERARSAVESYTPELSQGAIGAVTSTVYGLVSTVIGVFFGLFFLFFVLRDGHRFADWLARSTPLATADVHDVVRLTRESVRGYFTGTAITALLTAPIFMIPLLLFRVPLAIPIFVLYFFLSFIPYIGAWITGAFVVLIALGSSGTTAALVLGVTFVISNGSIQSAVSSWALGASLTLHPITVLLATMVGGTIAGVTSMVFGPPVVAATVKSIAAIHGRRYTPTDPDRTEIPHTITHRPQKRSDSRLT